VCFYRSVEIASVALVAMNQVVRSIDTVLGGTNCLSATSATLAISADP
jgi:hypothetical protein